ncbi:hypothetical protein IKG48_02690, partial [Candidatus Saccharibacteria bacterium]|nr:hypothetical protein [Candidatus Saccharibacteria bacterium]
GIASTTGSGTHNVGDTVTISATPSSTYHFSSWTVNSGGITLASTTNSSTTFTMPDNDVTITANGAINTHTVSITSGTGISSTTGAGTYSVGQTVNISATPSSGYNFSSWTVNSGGASLASTTSSSTSFTMPDANVTITANGVLAVQNCSSTVHPTTTTGCKMADGKIWILGNNGNTIAWNNMFTGATGANNHNATVKSGICPAGYSAPTIVDYDNLISAYGGTPFSSGRRGYQESTGALYSMLGLSDYRSFWSSTENNSSYAYRLSGDSSFSDSSSYDNKGSNFYVLCYK